MLEKIELDPKDPEGKNFVGRNDFGDDIKNLFCALNDVMHQIRNQPEDTPAAFDTNLKFIETISFKNAENTYLHYLPQVLTPELLDIYERNIS